MALDYRATAHAMRKAAQRYLLSTPQRRWTTYGVLAAFALSCVLMPPMGLAVFGGAFAAWWLAVAVVTFIGALIGNRVGVHSELKAKQSPADS